MNKQHATNLCDDFLENENEFVHDIENEIDFSKWYNLCNTLDFVREDFLIHFENVSNEFTKICSITNVYMSITTTLNEIVNSLNLMPRTNSSDESKQENKKSMRLKRTISSRPRPSLLICGQRFTSSSELKTYLESHPETN